MAVRQNYLPSKDLVKRTGRPESVGFTSKVARKLNIEMRRSSGPRHGLGKAGGGFLDVSANLGPTLVIAGCQIILNFFLSFPHRSKNNQQTRQEHHNHVCNGS
jgi:hypothetical protein